MDEGVVSKVYKAFNKDPSELTEDQWRELQYEFQEPWQELMEEAQESIIDREKNFLNSPDLSGHFKSVTVTGDLHLKSSTALILPENLVVHGNVYIGDAHPDPINISKQELHRKFKHYLEQKKNSDDDDGGRPGLEKVYESAPAEKKLEDDDLSTSWKKAQEEKSEDRVVHKPSPRVLEMIKEEEGRRNNKTVDRDFSR